MSDRTNQFCLRKPTGLERAHSDKDIFKFFLNISLYLPSYKNMVKSVVDKL